MKLPRRTGVALLLLAGCASAPETRDLAGTTWRLVEFRSSDDRVGVVRPRNPEQYTMMLGRDGRASLRLDCNRASGTWQATPSGGFTFGPLAMTRAHCPPPSLDTQIARDAGHVRAFLVRDGLLYLNLMADGGTYVWERQ